MTKLGKKCISVVAASVSKWTEQEHTGTGIFLYFIKSYWWTHHTIGVLVIACGLGHNVKSIMVSVVETVFLVYLWKLFIRTQLNTTL